MKKPRLLQDQYPTRYMPHVGRQVMQEGGTPESLFPRSQEEENIRANDLVNYAKQLDERERNAARGELLGQTWPVRLAKGIVEGAKSGATVAGDALYGRLDPRSDEAIKRAMDLTGMVMTGGMPLGYQVGKQAANEGKALLGIFAGSGAKTADLEALKRAQEMAASGASRDDIWSKTGWFQGADKNWRFEIPDYRAEYSYPRPGELAAGQRDTVGNRVYHDELFKAYPELANIEHRALTPNKELRASYIPGKKPDLSDYAIELYEPKGRLSSMLHELQHAIQEKEGWASGSNLAYSTGQVRRELYEKYRDNSLKMLEIKDKQVQVPVNSPEYKALSREWKELNKEGNKIYKIMKDPKRMEELGNAAYRNSAGEVEARNVQARLPFLKEDFKDLPPWSTEDVPLKRQRVFYLEKPKADGGSVVDRALMVVSRQGLPLPKPPNRQHGGRPRT